MKHVKTLFALLAVLALTVSVACQKETEDSTGHSFDDVPSAEAFSLTGTAWMMVQDEWWTPSMHVIDTSIWRFLTDSTGIINEHTIYNDDDPYGVETYPMSYTFDATTLTGVLYGYEEPLEFTYHSADTTLSYMGGMTQTVYVYHLLEEP